MLKKKLRILVCPLDWGLGHATRCVPVIKQLLRDNHDVILAGSGSSAAFLRGAFPHLPLIHLTGFRIRYPRGRGMALKLGIQLPGIIRSVFREHRLLCRIIRDHAIDVVISDNRFGLYSKEAYSVYITHQLMIKAPPVMRWSETILRRAHRWFINRYDECWIPDLPGENNLSGDLAHRFPVPGHAVFTGPLSRFEMTVNDKDEQPGMPPPGVLVMLSGPEPQRSAFEDIILEQIDGMEITDVIVLRGLPGKGSAASTSQGARIYSHLPDDEIRALILSAKVIICRSGYSTLMDLYMLQRVAYLVPTPGQPEQEYLAGYHMETGRFGGSPQKNFHLATAIESMIGDQPELTRNPRSEMLGEVIRKLPESVAKKHHGRKNQLHSY